MGKKEDEGSRDCPASDCDWADSRIAADSRDDRHRENRAVDRSRIVGLKGLIDLHGSRMLDREVPAWP